MPWDFGAGVAAAAGAGAGLMGDAIKRERDLQGATDLEALKQKVEQDKLARIAGIVKGVSRTATTTVDDESGGHTVTAPKNDGTYSREVGDALTGAGFIDQGGKAYDRADRYEDKLDLRTTQAAKQASDEARWKASQDQAERFHKDTLKLQQQQLNLRGKDSADFAKAADSYIENKSQYDSLVAEGKGNDPDIIAAAKLATDRAALQLRQFKVDVGDDTSPFAKRMQLSSTLNSLDTMLKDPMLKDSARAKAEAAREGVLDQMAAVTGGKGGGVSDFDAKFPPKNAPAAAAGKPAVSAAPPFAGVTARLSYPQTNGSGTIQVRDKL